MPTITVSDDVLQKLRAMKKTADETDDAVLARLIADPGDREARLRAYEAAEQDISSTN